MGVWPVAWRVQITRSQDNGMFATAAEWQRMQMAAVAAAMVGLGAQSSPRPAGHFVELETGVLVWLSPSSF